MTNYLPSNTAKSRVTYNESLKYSFNTTWFDKVADKDREYVCTVYVDTQEIEIFDVFKKNIFLKRSPFPELDLKKFYIGNAVVVHGRQHNIVGFANEFTRNALNVTEESTCAIIKPHAYGSSPQVLINTLDAIGNSGLQIVELTLLKFEYEDATKFYAEYKDTQDFEPLIDALTAGPSVFIQIKGTDAIAKWNDIVGPVDPRQCSGRQLRGKYGKSAYSNAFHASQSPQQVQYEVEICKNIRPVCAQQNSRTSVIVLEPTFKNNYCDMLEELFRLVEKISGLQISGIHSADPVALDVDEIFKAYQGVIPNWRQYCDAFDDGMCIAIELVGTDDVIGASRDIVGPFDPEIAKILKPNSLRAKFGKNVVQNGFFVTDISEEADIHSDFWFKVIE